MSKIIAHLNRLSTFASHHNDSRASFSLSTFRPLTLGLLLTFNFSLLIFNSCGLDIEDSTPPSPPVWVPKSLPEEWPERGIDAHELGGIYLEWEENPEESIPSYLIYRAEFHDEKDSLGKYQLLSQLGAESTNKLEYLDADVELSTKYYYRLKAVDNTDKKSAFSDSVHYSLLPGFTPTAFSPNGFLDTLSADRELSWSYPYTIEMENYCLTILADSDDLVCREVFTPTSYTGSREFWSIPDSIQLNDHKVYRWRIDTGADYWEGIEFSGAESIWAYFVYIEE